GVCQGARRVRRDDYIRVEHPRGNADAGAGHLRLQPGAGGRGADLAPGDAVGCRVVCGAARVRVARPSRPEAALMAISVRIRHTFDRSTLDIDLSLTGGLMALLGPSGAGKTRTLDVIAGVFRPDHAMVTIDDETLADTARGLWTPAHRRLVGYVFQDARLFPHLTVRQNLEYGRWFARRRGGHHSLPEVVDLLGLEQLLSRHPARLSGGEARRVSLGRALLSAPRLLLLDEPLGSLEVGGGRAACRRGPGCVVGAAAAAARRPARVARGGAPAGDPALPRCAHRPAPHSGHLRHARLGGSPVPRAADRSHRSRPGSHRAFVDLPSVDTVAAVDGHA